MQDFHKYLAKTSTEDKWGLYVTTVGCSTVKEHQSYPINQDHPLSHTFTWNRGRVLKDYYLVFIIKGSGVLETAHLGSIEINEGDCFVLHSGVWHRYKPFENTGWEEYWVGFNGFYPRKLMKSDFFNKKSPVIHVGLSQELLLIFHALIKTIKNASPGYHQLISGLTLQILAIAYNASVYKEENKEDDFQYILKAKFLLQEKIGEKTSMTHISKKLAVSYSKFRKDFKYVTGVSPNQYHLEIRLTKAAELLEASNLSITEIAYQTGFETLFYFSRIFKKKYEMSPKDYRLRYS